MARQGKGAPESSTPMARLTIRVQPGAKSSEVVGLAGNVVFIRVAAPAREGKANEALLELLSRVLGVPKSRIQTLKGAASRHKLLSIEGLTQQEALHKLQQV